MISTNVSDGVPRQTQGQMKHDDEYDQKQQPQPQQQNQHHHQHEWEYMKENSAPLQRGRNIVTLTKNHYNQYKRNEEDDEMKHINHTIQQYEERIKRQQIHNQPPNHSTIDDDNNEENDLDRTDPIRIWVSYIKYIQDVVYPKSNPQSKSIFTLFERCVHTFCTISLYQNDIRFIRICCLYADLTLEPLQTFYELWDHYNIGTQSAIYYNAWAFIAEKYHYYTIAEQIFQYGLYPPSGITTVEPKEYLLLRYKRFQKRMSRYWRNLQQEQGLLDMNDLSTGTSAGINCNANNNNNNNNINDHSQSSHIQELTNHYHPTTKNNQQHRAILGPLSSTTHRNPNHQHVPSFLIQSSSSSSSLVAASRQRLTNNIQPTFMDRTNTHRFTSQTTQNQLQQPQSTFTIFSDHTNVAHVQPISEIDPQPEQLFFKRLSAAKSETGSSTIASKQHHDHRPITEADRWKENHGQIEKWNEHGSLRSAYNTGNDSISNPNPLPVPINNRSNHRHIQSNTVVGFAIHIDDECIQQQQHEENERQEYTKQQRLARDDRLNDPINSKISKSNSNNTNRKEKSKDVKLPTKPMWRNRLLTNPITYDEQCFEESRFYNGQYKLLQNDTMNINLLFVNNNQKDVNEHDDDDDNSHDSNEMSMSMEELLTASIHDESFGPATSTSVTNMTPNSFHSQHQHENHRKFQIETPILNDNNLISTLQDHDAIYQHHNNTNNTSTASSTLDEMKMFGSYNNNNNNNHHNIHIQSNEPTINTQFALRELSFMFTSPVQPSESVPTDVHQQKVSSGLPVKQSHQSSMTTNNFHPNENKPLTFDIFNDEDVHDESVIPVDNYLKKNEVNSNLNFTIFDDESKSQPPPPQQSNLALANRRVSSVVQPSTSTNTFTIFCDDSTEIILNKDVENMKSKPNMQISPVSDHGTTMTIPFAVGDTAEFTISELQKWQEQSDGSLK